MRIIKNAERAINLYGDYYCKHKEEAKELIEYLNRRFDSVVLWGAGLKGSAFLMVCDAEDKMIEYVIDMDSCKNNMQLESGHVIKGIDAVKPNSAIIISNVNYYSSVCFSLINAGYDVKKLHLISLDDYFEGKVTLDMIISNQLWNWRRYYD